MTYFFPRAAPINDFPFRLINKVTGDAVTSGTVTVFITKDGGAQAAATNSPTHNGNGEWLLDITGSERDAGYTAITINHNDIVPQHFTIFSADELGAGAKQVDLQFGSNGRFGNVWVKLDGEVVGSGQADASGNITFYLDVGVYEVYFQRPGYNFSNPYSLTVSADATVTLTVTAAAAPLDVNAYASISTAQAYFDTILHTENWDNATSADQNKALLMATRAINLLSFVGDPTQVAVDAGNQFPRGSDTEVPEEIVWATCEEALALLGNDTTEEARDALRIKSERFSGADVSYTDHHPEHIRSGLLSVKAWDFLGLYLRDDRSIRLIRT